MTRAALALSLFAATAFAFAVVYLLVALPTFFVTGHIITPAEFFAG